MELCSECCSPEKGPNCHNGEGAKVLHKIHKDVEGGIDIVLRHRDFKNMFYVQCDSSDTGVRAVIFHIAEDNNKRPVAFFLQKLNPAQRNYSIREKRCLAAV